MILSIFLVINGDGVNFPVTFYRTSTMMFQSMGGFKFVQFMQRLGYPKINLSDLAAQCGDVMPSHMARLTIVEIALPQNQITIS
jgi:hypothetical protein